MVLSDRTSATASFEAPDVTALDTPDVLVFQLTVSDGSRTDSDEVSITVNDAGLGANSPPIADAGPDQSVQESSAVNLDGTGGNEIFGTIHGPGYSGGNAFGNGGGIYILYGAGEVTGNTIESNSANLNGGGLSAWIDTFGTLMVFSEGSCSDDGKTRVMTTRFNDLVDGGILPDDEHSGAPVESAPVMDGPEVDPKEVRSSCV